MDSHGRVLASLQLAHSVGWSMRAVLDVALDLGRGLVIWPGIGKATDGVAVFLEWEPAGDAFVVRRVRNLGGLHPWVMMSAQRVVVLPRHVIAVRTPEVGDRLVIRS